MVSIPGLGQLRRLEKRWALGATLSLAVHLVGGAVLVAVVLRAEPPRGGTATSDLVEVSTVEEPAGDGAGAAVDEGAVAEPDAPASSAEPDQPRRPSRAQAPRARSRRTVATTKRAPVARPPAVVALAAPAPKPPSAGTARAESAPGASARAAIRAQLRRHLHDAWRANEVYQRIDPEGALAGSLFTTAVQVRLRADGTLARADLGDSSGMHALDKEALAALQRMRPLPRLPPEVLDAEGVWSIRCKFHLDVGMFRFAADVRRTLTAQWRPSKAFEAAGDKERTTVVRMMVTRDGALQSAEVMTSAGIDFLDASTLAALRPGLQLPAPPRSFTRQPGPATVFAAFLHQAGEVRVLRPREDIEEE